jgi:ribosomal protein S18 acetylase RimI-like enzyme
MIVVRAFRPADAESVDLIMNSSTRELRAVYAPKPKVENSSVRHSSSSARVVAMDNADTAIGVAECIVHPLALYVQGIAVASTHRRRGVARALLEHIATLAVDLGLPAVRVATIKETGNVEVFKRLGFDVIEERTSERFLGLHGQPVTEVTLKRHVS